MAAYVWTSGSSGYWGTAANWGTTTLPTLDDTVQIAVPNITVTISAGYDAQAYSLQTISAGLDIAGTLQTVSNASLDGYLREETTGVFVAGGYGATSYAGLTLLGTVDLLTGASLNVLGGGSIDGTLSGSGTLDIGGGETYLGTGFADKGTSFYISGGGLGLYTNVTTAANFTLASNGILDMFAGSTLTLQGNVTLDGTVSGGEVIETKTADFVIGAPGVLTYLDDGLIMAVGGSVVQQGNIALGASDAGAKIIISKTGLYDITGNWYASDPSTTGSISNAGLFEKTGGGKTATIYTSFSSTGTVSSEIGVLTFDGLVNSLAGKVTGTGTVAIGGVGETVLGSKLALNVACFDQQSSQVILNKALSYNGEWDMTGGVLNLNSTTATLTLTGQADFDGGLVTGFGGGVSIAKGATAEFANVVFGSTTTLTVLGAVDQTGSITFGASSNPVGTIAAGAVWQLEANSSIGGFFGIFYNYGTLIDVNGSGISAIDPELISYGTITVNNGVLQLDGASALSGSITGNGLFDLADNATLESGLAISVARLNIDNGFVGLAGNLSYANAFTQSGGYATLAPGGFTLSLSGTVSLDAGRIDGAGEIISAGNTTIGGYAIEYGGTLALSGAAEQTAQLDFIGGALIIDSTANYTIDDDYSIVALSASTDLVSNAGTINANGTQISAIQPLYTQTGVLNVNDAALELAGGGSLAGTVAGTGTLDLAGGSFTLNAGLTLSVLAIEVAPAATVTLASNESFGGEFVGYGTTNLGTHTLTLSGTAFLQSETLNGPGTLAASGTSMLSSVTIQAGAVVDVTGTAEQSGGVALNAGALVIGTGANYSMDVDTSITGAGTLTVNGTLTSGADGTASISPNIVDAGLISASLGTLNILGSVTGAGNFLIGKDAELQFGGAAKIGASPTIGFTAGGGELYIGDMANFGAHLSGFATGDSIEIYGISGATAQGSLSGDVYTVTDGNHDSISLTFTSAPTSLSVTSAADGFALIVHH